MPPVSLNSSNIHASHVEVVCNFAAGEVGHWYHLRKPCEVDAETLWRPTIVGFLAKIDIPSHSQRPPSPGETPWFVPAMTWNVRMNGGGCNLKQRHKKGWRRKGRTKNTQNFGLQKWDHEIHRFLMIFIYFYNVQNGMLHWVGLLCFYYRSAHGERVGCDRTTWLRRKKHRGSTQKQPQWIYMSAGCLNILKFERCSKGCEMFRRNLFQMRTSRCGWTPARICSLGSSRLSTKSVLLLTPNDIYADTLWCRIWARIFEVLLKCTSKIRHKQKHRTPQHFKQGVILRLSIFSRWHILKLHVQIKYIQIRRSEKVAMWLNDSCLRLRVPFQKL